MGMKKYHEDMLIEKYSYGVLYASVLIIIVRLISTFVFAYVFSQTWHFRLWHDWLPIVAFDTGQEVFEKINSYSFLATMFVFTFFFLILSSRYIGKVEDVSNKLSKELYEKLLYTRIKVYVAFTATFMVFVEAVVGWYLARYLHFGVTSIMWIPMIVMLTVAIFEFGRVVAKARMIRSSHHPVDL